jgi:enhancing lycopene biosynthesis protein 2
MPRVAVCLSGCGVFDGSEIHEAVLTLLALDQAGAQVVCCAPDIDQAAVVNHLTRAPVPSERRSVLAESARIARGAIVDLATVRADDIDALIFPGGYGAATNLCTFATEGAECRVNPDVERLVGEMLAAGKPIGAICIAPAMLARIAGRRAPGARLTIGNERETAAAVEQMGAAHVECACADFVVDEKNRIVSTPAYMLGKGPADVFEGIRKLVGEVLRLARSS